MASCLPCRGEKRTDMVADSDNQQQHLPHGLHRLTGRPGHILPGRLCCQLVQQPLPALHRLRRPGRRNRGVWPWSCRVGSRQRPAAEFPLPVLHRRFRLVKRHQTLALRRIGVITQDGGRIDAIRGQGKRPGKEAQEKRRIPRPPPQLRARKQEERRTKRQEMREDVRSVVN